MNELYKLLQNVQEIAIANNEFLKSFDARLATLETQMSTLTSEVEALAKSMIIDPEPNATGAEE